MITPIVHFTSFESKPRIAINVSAEDAGDDATFMGTNHTPDEDRRSKHNSKWWWRKMLVVINSSNKYWRFLHGNNHHQLLSAWSCFDISSAAVSSSLAPQCKRDRAQMLQRLALSTERCPRFSHALIDETDMTHEYRNNSGAWGELIPRNFLTWWRSSVSLSYQCMSVML